MAKENLRKVIRTQLNIYDGDLLVGNYFCKKAPSHMFDQVLNTPLSLPNRNVMLMQLQSQSSELSQIRILKLTELYCKIFYVGMSWYLLIVVGFRAVILNPVNANSTKWSNTVKQFVGFCRRIVWACLTILWGWSLKCYKHPHNNDLHKVWEIHLTLIHCNLLTSVFRYLFQLFFNYY